MAKEGSCTFLLHCARSVWTLSNMIQHANWQERLKNLLRVFWKALRGWMSHRDDIGKSRIPRQVQQEGEPHLGITTNCWVGSAISWNLAHRNVAKQKYYPPCFLSQILGFYPFCLLWNANPLFWINWLCSFMSNTQTFLYIANYKETLKQLCFANSSSLKALFILMYNAVGLRALVTMLKWVLFEHWGKAVSTTKGLRAAL